MLVLLALACSGADPDATSLPAMPAGPAAQSAPEATMDGSGVVATWSGGSLTYDQLLEEGSDAITSLDIEYLQNRYQVEQGVLREVVIYSILETEATARGTDVEGLLKIEVEDKITKPTEAEVAEYYQVVQRQLRGASLEEAYPMVEGALIDRKAGERMEVFLVELEAKYQLQTQLPFPDLPKIDVSVDDDPMLGNPDAVVTIVEFADYQCGYCRKIYPTLLELMEDYPDQIRVVYRDYPLSGGGGGLEPIVAANCAGEQDKYWPMHDELMRNTNYQRVAIEAYGTKVGLDMDQFRACIDAPEAQYEEVMKDFQDGQKAGVSGTPAFFVNGVFLNGALPKDQFVAVIEKELSK
jgi:protein-disulfide isomerase